MKKMTLLMALIIVSLTIVPSCKKYDDQPRFPAFDFLPQLSIQYDWTWDAMKLARDSTPPADINRVTNHEYDNCHNCYVINILSETDRLLEKVQDRYYDGAPITSRDKKWTPEKVFDRYTKPAVSPTLYALYPDLWDALMKKEKAYVCDVINGNITATDATRRNELVNFLDTPKPGDYSGKTWGAYLKDEIKKLYTSAERPKPIKDGLLNLSILNGP